MVIRSQTRCAVRSVQFIFYSISFWNKERSCLTGDSAIVLFFLMGRKVMPYRRQRKAASHKSHANLGNVASPKGEGQVR